MPPKTKGYTHRDRFTPYMRRVIGMLPKGEGGPTLLDIPAGAGHFGDAMTGRGYRVTNADFNRDRDDFVFADMSKRLPFEDDSFDVVTCLEGIEHMHDPFALVGELARVCRPGGLVVISTPNILNYHSRFQFLFTGTFAQFCPTHIPTVAPDAELDHGHISPMGFAQLRSIGLRHGLEITGIGADKFKRIMLAPLFWLLELAGWPWKRRMFLGRKAAGEPGRNRDIWRAYCHPALLFGRTIILRYRKHA